jgi:hypothetical protein
VRGAANRATRQVSGGHSSKNVFLLPSSIFSRQPYRIDTYLSLRVNICIVSTASCNAMIASSLWPPNLPVKVRRGLAKRVIRLGGVDQIIHHLSRWQREAQELVREVDSVEGEQLLQSNAHDLFARIGGEEPAGAIDALGQRQPIAHLSTTYGMLCTVCCASNPKLLSRPRTLAGMLFGKRAAGSNRW